MNLSKMILLLPYRKFIADEILSDRLQVLDQLFIYHFPLHDEIKSLALHWELYLQDIFDRDIDEGEGELFDGKSIDFVHDDLAGVVCERLSGERDGDVVAGKCSLFYSLEVLVVGDVQVLSEADCVGEDVVSGSEVGGYF